MIGYNSTMPISCFYGNGNCKNCQKKYGCMTYAISLLETMSISSPSGCEQVVKNLEIMYNFQQECCKQLNDKMDKCLEENNENTSEIMNQISNLSTQIGNLSSQLSEDVSTILDKIDKIKCKCKDEEDNNGNDINGIPKYEGETEIVLKTPMNENLEKGLSVKGNFEKEPETIWKEKKGLFGKTKWVEEDINKSKK